MFLQTMSLITEDCLIYSCTQKLSLSLLVTTVWTLEASTCGPAFQASEGRLAQLTMTLAANTTPLLNHGDLGRCVHEQFCVFPFIFNSFYEVGTDVRRTYGCVTTNTWEMIWRWVFLQIPLDPSVPFSPPQPSHLSYILYLH